MLASVLFSVTPAFRLFFPRALPASPRTLARSANNTWRRLGSKLVVVELATAVVLLVVAGLLGKSLYLLLRVQLGLHPDNLATLQITVPQSAYPKDPQVIALAGNMQNQILQLPGVKSVGLSTDLPVNGWGDTTWFRIIGRPWHGEHYEVAERDISPQYFDALALEITPWSLFQRGGKRLETARRNHQPGDGSRILPRPGSD